MLLYPMIGLAVGIVLALLLVTMRRAQPVLLPVLLVLGIAGLSFAVQWQKEQDRRSHEAANAAQYNGETAAITREEATIIREEAAPPAQPPVIVPLSSPLQRPPSGAAAPPAVTPPYRSGNPS